MCLPTVDELWRQLTRASADRRHPWRVVAFCTQGAQGPAARSVILRQVGVDQRRLVFYTDARSAKLVELAACPQVALLLWDPGHRQQLRITGLASVEADHDSVQRHWAAVPPTARADYAQATAPGTPLEGSSDSDPRAALDLETAQRHFTVVTVQVQSMDFLQLNRDTHHRGRFDWDPARGQWGVQGLVP
jgi:pyridoxine/pyridoxamine 5'-phosphate oxidase